MRAKRFVRAIVAAICLCSAAQAGTYVWDGGNGVPDTTWSQADNWNPDGAPKEVGDAV